ncbi:hypothetical protein [Treponema phagedenis]|uniref:Uncharacterized protein n=1 Tax=Treponema phagedenis TaxID=162 RepID=A0A7H8VI40_TREPH|nr:hypothetical protein [Treponema phagedenis]NVP22715.1 hypothetical protein [Treponema phagedenis]NVP23236.1 hypothetical protein [Treponema phagedenis]QEJ95335.1 hypothetical protein FUT79_09045 [Treponema phagedenis]QEJ97957.1 hypothetical protein FUT82_08075 [Treponema phagedenis]QEK01187.1 hypothetical protein FUT84_08510 [Treponema phagedenis]
MTITAELVQRIRALLNEKIPNGGTAADTNFADTDIAAVLQIAESENHALFILWTQKSSLVQKDANFIKRIQAGGESVERYTAGDYANLFLKIAQGYKDLWEAEKKNSSPSFLMFNKKDDALW